MAPFWLETALNPGRVMPHLEGRKPVESVMLAVVMVPRRSQWQTTPVISRYLDVKVAPDAIYAA